MKTAYPVIFTRAKEGGFTCFVPDFEINTQGDTLAEAIENSRDAICVIAIDREDDGMELPEPSLTVEHTTEEFASFVDVDFEEYRKKNNQRAIRRNVSLPSWLNAEAEKAGLNVSAVLQNALKQELGVE